MSVNLSEIFKSRRKKLCIKQTDLAELSGVSLPTVKDIERGVGNPSFSTILRLFEVLGLEIDVHLRKTE